MWTGRRDFVHGNKLNDIKTWTLWDQPSQRKSDKEVVFKWGKKKRGLSVSGSGLVRRLRQPRSKDVSWVLSNIQKPNHRIPQRKLSKTRKKYKFPKTDLSNIPKPNYISNTPQLNYISNTPKPNYQTKLNYQIPETIIIYQSICCCLIFTKPHKIQSLLSKGCIHLHGPWEKWFFLQVVF